MRSIFMPAFVGIVVAGCGYPEIDLGTAGVSLRRLIEPTRGDVLVLEFDPGMGDGDCFSLPADADITLNGTKFPLQPAGARAFDVCRSGHGELAPVPDFASRDADVTVLSGGTVRRIVVPALLASRHVAVSNRLAAGASHDLSWSPESDLALPTARIRVELIRDAQYLVNDVWDPASTFGPLALEATVAPGPAAMRTTGSFEPVVDVCDGFASCRSSLTVIDERDVQIISP